MINFFNNLNSVNQTLIATLFTWSITALGAALVFFFKKINKNLLDAMLGFSAGVMISASFFSLISPSIEMASNLNMNVWLTAFIGFMDGGILLFLGDKIFDKIYTKKEKNYKNNFEKKKSLKRAIMLVVSITLHNIPEGMAIGVAFGSIIYGLDGATVVSACILALGIGIQNFPEGTAISLPLLREGYSRKKSFFLGQLSGIVEPISGIIGTLLAGFGLFFYVIAAGDYENIKTIPVQKLARQFLLTVSSLALLIRMYLMTICLLISKVKSFIQ